jgi:hypothetical protein
VDTFSWNGVFTATDRGALVISSDGLFAAEPTSPNSVETHRSPFWKPSCGASVLVSQLLVRTPRPAPGGGVAPPAGGVVAWAGGVVAPVWPPPALALGSAALALGSAALALGSPALGALALGSPAWALALAGG